MKRIIFYATTTPFQKEKYVRLSALNELSIAGGWPEQSTFHLGPIGMAMKGAPSTLVVCVEGGGGTGRSEVGNLVDFSISIYSLGHQCIRWGGDTLFRGIGHRAPWGGHHSYIVGVW